LAPLRERREWLDVAGQLRGGVSDNSLVQLRSEAKAPFRLTRLIFGSGLLFGAGLGLLIIGARLVQAIQGMHPLLLYTLFCLSYCLSCPVSVLCNGVSINFNFTTHQCEKRQLVAS
jgi:hypothetical protein